MARVFIFDCKVDRIRQLTRELEAAGHDVASNMDCLSSTELSSRELSSTIGVNKLWTTWNGDLPDALLVECLDIDSERFLQILNTPFPKNNIQVIVMSDHHARNNTKLQRLMATYNAFCVEWPINIVRFLAFAQDPVMRSHTSDPRQFESGVVFD